MRLKSKRVYSLLLPLFIIAAVLWLADQWLLSYEQHQQQVSMDQDLAPEQLSMHSAESWASWLSQGGQETPNDSSHSDSLLDQWIRSGPPKDLPTTGTSYKGFGSPSPHDPRPSAYRYSGPLVFQGPNMAGN